MTASVELLCTLYDERPRALALLVFPPHDLDPEALSPDNPKSPRPLLQAKLDCDDDTLAILWGAMTGPVQDRYLRRRTGRMQPMAAELAKRIVPLMSRTGRKS